MKTWNKQQMKVINKFDLSDSQIRTLRSYYYNYHLADTENRYRSLYKVRWALKEDYTTHHASEDILRNRHGFIEKSQVGYGNEISDKGIQAADILFGDEMKKIKYILSATQEYVENIDDLIEENRKLIYGLFGAFTYFDDNSYYTPEVSVSHEDDGTTHLSTVVGCKLGDEGTIVFNIKFNVTYLTYYISSNVNVRSGQHIVNCLSAYGEAAKITAEMILKALQHDYIKPSDMKEVPDA